VWQNGQLWLGAPHLPVTDHGIRLDADELVYWTSAFKARRVPWRTISKLSVTVANGDNRPRRGDALRTLAAVALPLIFDGPGMGCWIRVEGQLGDVWHQFDASALPNWSVPLTDIEVYAADAVLTACWRLESLRRRIDAETGPELVRRLSTARHEAEVDTALAQLGY
jgi:hypothetical protein